MNKMCINKHPITLIQNQVCIKKSSTFMTNTNTFMYQYDVEYNLNFSTYYLYYVENFTANQRVCLRVKDSTEIKTVASILG